MPPPPAPRPFPRLGTHRLHFCRCRFVRLGHFASTGSYSVRPFVPGFPHSASCLRGSPLGWWVSALRPFSRPSHSRCVRKGSAFCLGAVGADAGPWAVSRVFLSVTRGLASLAQRSPAFLLLVPRSWSSALCLGSGVQGCPSCHTGSFCAPACRHLERPPWTTLWVNSGCTR